MSATRFIGSSGYAKIPIAFLKTSPEHMFMRTTNLLGPLNSKDLDEWLIEIPDGNAWLARICGARVEDVSKWRQGTPFPHQQQNIRIIRLMHLAALSRAGDESLIDYALLNERLCSSTGERGGYKSVSEMSGDYIEARTFISLHSD